MRNLLAAIIIASALTMTVAQAAPFGPSSHRLGGGASSSKSSETPKTVNFVEALLGIIGIEPTASVEPVVGESYVSPARQTEECDQAKKSEVAKAETKEDAQGASSKGRARPGDPVYLAF